MLRAPQVLNVSLIFGTVMIFEVVLTVAAVMPYLVVGVTAFVRDMVLAAFAMMMPAASRCSR